MRPIIITIPAPPAQLSPNARCHWRVKAEAVKSFRQAAMLAGRGHSSEPLRTASVQATFFVGVRRRRDGDNALASLKAAFDGLRDAGVIEDDSGLRHEPVEFVYDKARAGTVELRIVKYTPPRNTLEIPSSSPCPTPDLG